MHLRNLNITDANIHNKDLIIDGINELHSVIMDNYYDTLTREIGIEFNIGSRLGEPREYLVIYANPDYKNNPYIFVLKQTEQGKVLVNNTSIESFIDLADLDIRREINKVIAIGFKHLPSYAFLGEQQIIKARNFAIEYDERD